MNLIDVITAITDIPNTCLKEDVNESIEYNKYLKILKFQYRSIGAWLNYYLLDRQELYEILIKPDIGYYKPLAEKVGLDYKFLQEIKLLSSEF